LKNIQKIKSCWDWKAIIDSYISSKITKNFSLLEKINHQQIN
jgi:hypothetical protein